LLCAIVNDRFFLKHRERWNGAAVVKPRILLADDHPLIIEGLRSVLSSDFEIVGVAADGREVVAEAIQLQPDAVVLDVSMPLLNGVEAARHIKTAVPQAKILFISQNANREYVRVAFGLGASAYIAKDGLATEAVPALRAALAGRYYVSPSLLSGIPQGFFSAGKTPVDLFGANLTSRQREVLQLVAEGKSNKEIAAILNVSLKTVDFHKAKLMDELGLRTAAELTRYALEHGITSK
jgi:DNA-binding NarL/FixJ family response regulator